MMLKNRLLQTFLPINNQEMMRHLKHDFVHHEMNNDDNNIKNNNNNQNDTVFECTTLKMLDGKRRTYVGPLGTKDYMFETLNKVYTKGILR